MEEEHKAGCIEKITWRTTRSDGGRWLAAAEPCREQLWEEEEEKVKEEEEGEEWPQAHLLHGDLGGLVSLPPRCDSQVHLGYDRMPVHVLTRLHLEKVPGSRQHPAVADEGAP